MLKIIKDIGEIGLIEKIKKTIKCHRRVIYGIGDDAAVLGYNKDKYLLFTSDMLIEGVHFKKGTDFKKIGHKALACSLSDAAAMGGGRSLFAVVSLGLPANTAINSIKRLYSGINELADKFGVCIVGGDTNRAGNFVIDISLLGEIKKEKLVLRSNAKINDLIFVTGKLGGSYKSGRHLSFTPCVKEAQFLTQNFKINSMIDISDGLAVDLKRITSSSSVGAVLYEGYIPKNKDAQSIEDALYTGEDFQLLFTLSPPEAEKLLAMKNNVSYSFSFIGQIMPKKFGLKIIDKSCKERQLLQKGFRHF